MPKFVDRQPPVRLPPSAPRRRIGADPGRLAGPRARPAAPRRSRRSPTSSRAARSSSAPSRSPTAPTGSPRAPARSGARYIMQIPTIPSVFETRLVDDEWVPGPVRPRHRGADGRGGRRRQDDHLQDQPRGRLVRRRADHLGRLRVHRAADPRRRRHLRQDRLRPDRGRRRPPTRRPRSSRSTRRTPDGARCSASTASFPRTCSRARTAPR